MDLSGYCYLVDFSVPDVAKVHSYSTLERNGFIMFWHHAEGLDPQWTPPEIEEIAKGDWTYRGRSEHVINAHIEVAFRR
jgi:cholesterol 7-dehydrogenase